ncbi:hypothetical protein TELCIR_01331 [Teladorsagia circumcincta]|uniref:Ig-like domain-containing protein n=1 Tax=Teladorsagia circumcincta TaxID=45464 RepID=A0A2G9V260_TELCI|nr:hypothetical protein TELCIR_01331 [Teladorsagia circumcincta]
MNSVASALSPPVKVTVQYLDGFEEVDPSEQVLYAAEGGHFVIKRPALIANSDPLPNTDYSWYNGETQVVASVDGLGEAVSSIITVLQQDDARDGTRARWILDGVVISGTETGVELSQNNRRLTMIVPDALRSGRNEHNLECKVDAASGVLFDQRSLKIRVTEEPKLRPSPVEKFLPLGSRLTIPCSPRKHSGVPSKIQWYFNGNEV